MNSERSSLSAMIPSPTYTSKRSPERSYAEDQAYQNSRFTSTSLQISGVPHISASRRYIFQSILLMYMLTSYSASRYRIQVRQQPQAARACGFGERDRRVIDPPPIVQLIVDDPSGHVDPAELRYPFNVVHCTLWSADGLSDETALTGQDKRLTRRLMGTLVSSPFVDGNENCFFCFPDLSCRTHGQYRLLFALMRIEPSELQPDGFTPIIAETMSDVFTVYTAKEFPGMKPSTELTKSLKSQGCAISVKKGIEKPSGGPGSDNEDEKGPESRSNSNPRKRGASSRNGDNG